MLTLPREHLTLIQVFAPIFSQHIWQYIQILVKGLAQIGIAVTSRSKTKTSAETAGFCFFHASYLVA